MEVERLLIRVFEEMGLHQLPLDFAKVPILGWTESYSIVAVTGIRLLTRMQGRKERPLRESGMEQHVFGCLAQARSKTFD